jgi:hypothetical protein
MDARRRLGLGVLTVAVALVALAAPAGGYVYWGNVNTNSIARANLDGTGVNNNFINLPPPTRPAVSQSTASTSTGPTAPPATSGARTSTGPA